MQSSESQLSEIVNNFLLSLLSAEILSVKVQAYYINFPSTILLRKKHFIALNLSAH